MERYVWCVYANSCYNVPCYDDRTRVDLIRKSHTAPSPYHKIHHSEQKCAHFCSEWCIMWYWTGVLSDLCGRSVVIFPWTRLPRITLVYTWWWHGMETPSALLSLWKGNPLVTCGCFLCCSWGVIVKDFKALTRQWRLLLLSCHGSPFIMQ